MTSLVAEVRAAARTLAESGAPAAQPDAVALAAHALGVEAGEVRRRMVLGSPPPASFAGQYAALVAERARRVPLQHLTGRAAFRHLELAVGPGVFVPRPETELTAGLAIAATRPGAVVVDLCCGSGAIALSIADEVPRARVLGVELSEEALAWALLNRDRLGLDVELRQGDAQTAGEDLVGAVDVVVSNPPYIPDDAVPVDPEVRDHDPQLALYGGGADGLTIPLAVAARAAELLRPAGVLVMEHADVQGGPLCAALERAGAWDGIQDHRDLNGLPRAVTCRRTAAGTGPVRDCTP